MPSGIYKRTEETNKKISIAKKGKMPKFIPNNKGRKHSEETKRKISLRKKGCISPRKGIILSDEIKNKISNSKKGKIVGEKHWNWMGGKSFWKYTFDWTDDLRKSIRKRDNWTCQMSDCGIHQDELDGFQKQLAIHHIDYNKKNCNPDNLITLCQSCHMKTNFDRDYWINYFTENKN